MQRPRFQRIVFIWLAFLLAGNVLQAQQKYWVFFKDKNTAFLFNADEYFDGKAIQRRIKNHIPLNDSLCWPLDEQYVQRVKQITDSIQQESRWFNAVSVYATNLQVQELQGLACVKKIQPVISSSHLAAATDAGPEAEDVELMNFQTERMQGSKFSKAGFTGKGIRIAVFDAGFPSVDKHPAFQHLIKNGQIIKTYDFVKKRTNVFYSSSHGAAVLSCIAGRYEASSDSVVYIGLAQDAEFLLAKTERAFTEFVSEEDNWITAMEWADKEGADIISSSLGYTRQHYFNDEMDGRTSMLSIAANVAASRGILVVNAAGNEGQTYWRTVASPADADSVLSVGAVNPYMDVATGFSSLGPTSDGRLKPNVSAIGIACVALRHGYAVELGTSFAAPLVAGFAACAWQIDTSRSNMELFQLIEQSGHLYPYYDFSHGYGIPQAGFFLHQDSVPAPTVSIVDDSVWISVRITGALADTLQQEGKEPQQRNLYYRVETAGHRIRRYGVMLAKSLEPLHFYHTQLTRGDIITVHFEGYTTTFVY